MAISVVMPALEMAQETGKLVSWLKKEGEPVRKGEMLLEVETDKAVVEVEAAGDGILAAVTAKPGDVVPVGHTIAWLVQPGETPPVGGQPSAPSARRADAAPGGERTAVPGAAGRVLSDPAGAPAARLSPKARRLAQEHGVDLSRVKGSGPGGEILADDILAAARQVRLKPDTTTPGQAATSAYVASGLSRTETPSTVGRLMAERTTQSWTTVPHFFVTREVDATALNAARDELLPAVERSHGLKVTHTDILVAAVARALKSHPRVNASWTGSGIVLHSGINVALALAVENAVVTGVIRAADAASIGDVAARRRELTERARAGRLHPDDIAGATFTISNLGMYGVDAFTAIIVPPQAAILAVGAIADRVVAVDGRPAVRPMLTLTLSCDHRVVDGARAAEFMRDVVAALEE
ncbi:MAG: 2-oxo acid dehydrogenase subunit E2 [Acidobacteria bacterium]|nr:2-oxo acid dehydrogenase subunit E2 [Acidobacteriota bacterium]